MKVYRLKLPIYYNKFAYPEDMEKILTYLQENGDILVSPTCIEELYFKYSDECACHWKIVTEDTLENFAQWLDDYEV